MRAFPRASHVHPRAAWLQIPYTSHITSAPLDLAGSGNTATGCSMQSELLPSAWRVELPSKPHIGSSSSVGNSSKSSIFVLPRRFGTGSYPLAVLASAAERASALGPGAVAAAVTNLSTRLHAFEIS